MKLETDRNKFETERAEHTRISFKKINIYRYKSLDGEVNSITFTGCNDGYINIIHPKSWKQAKTLANRAARTRKKYEKNKDFIYKKNIERYRKFEPSLFVKWGYRYVPRKEREAGEDFWDIPF